MDNQKLSQTSIDEFWSDFLSATNRLSSTTYLAVFHFELTEMLANELLRLVLIGQKRATASSLWSYEAAGEALPQVNDLCIITYWDGVPHCVIETTNVTVLPFSEMTYEICQREGEDDSLASWREDHIRFFTSECESLGYAFDEQMPVVFEDFEVIYQV